MSERDYYEILGLTPRADCTMVDQAYWHLARKYQALAETNPHARAMLDELNEAYGVLGTPRLREQYDAFRDDVLIEAGVIQPVASKTPSAKTGGAKEPETSKKRPRRAQGPAGRRLAVSVPPVRAHWKWYGGGAVVVAFLAGGVWLSLSPLLVVGALCAVAAVASTRALKRQLPDIALMLPQVTMPELKTPRIDRPKVGDVPRLRVGAGGGSKDDALDANELRASTAAMISHWRTSVGLRAHVVAPAGEATASADEPSMTLVDIVRGERELEAEDVPLTAVIDVLRGPRRKVETK